MTPKDKTIIQIIKDELGTLVLTSIILGLPVLFVISLYERWNSDIKFVIALFCIVDILAMLAMVNANK